jgi:hypothetical protein
MIINDLYLTRSVHLLVEIKNTLRNGVERNFTKNYFLKLLSFRNLTDKVSTPGDDAVANNLSGSSFGSEIYSAILSSQPMESSKYSSASKSSFTSSVFSRR